MQTGENSIIEARILYHLTHIHNALICNKMKVFDVLFAIKYKCLTFMTLCLNTTINLSTPS